MRAFRWASTGLLFAVLVVSAAAAAERLVLFEYLTNTD
jgi:hypothetical protein